jgi:hypothetical protein
VQRPEESLDNHHSLPESGRGRKARDGVTDAILFVVQFGLN